MKVHRLASRDPRKSTIHRREKKLPSGQRSALTLDCGTLIFPASMGERRSRQICQMEGHRSYRYVRLLKECGRVAWKTGQVY